MRHKDSSLMDRILRYVDEYFRENSEAPSTTDIAQYFGIARSCAYNYLKEMDHLGMLRYQNGRLSTEVSEDYCTDTHTSLTCLDNVASCGMPSLEEEKVESRMPVPVSLFGPGKLYMLSASGNSMTGAGIDDGDQIIIRETTEARPGDIVVALIDNETTLKRYMIDRSGHPYLHAENPRYADIYPSQLIIQGVATRVIKVL